MSVADKLGLGPTRTVEALPGDLYRVTVTPPAWANCGNGADVTLTADQHQRYLKWRETGCLIQEALPDLSADDCEILMTGIGPELFAELFPEEDDE